MINKFEESDINKKSNSIFSQKHLITEMARIDALNHETQKILDGHQVWVYGYDRPDMTPHFIFFTADQITFYIEINLLDLSIIQIKHKTKLNKPYTWEGIGNKYSEMIFKWVSLNDNYNKLLEFWDALNSDNDIGENKRKELVENLQIT